MPSSVAHARSTALSWVRRIWLLGCCEQSQNHVCFAYAHIVAGEPGNEAGYVVKIQDDNLSPPYTLQPGGKIRLVSEYDASQRRLGATLVSPCGFHSSD